MTIELPIKVSKSKETTQAAQVVTWFQQRRVRENTLLVVVCSARLNDYYGLSKYDTILTS